jgi:vitamin B12 transporter
LQDQSNKPIEASNEPFSSKSFDLETKANLATIKAVLERRLFGLSAFRFGGEYLYFTDKNDFSNKYVHNSITKATDHYKAGFAEADIYVTNDLAAKIGGRFEHSSIINKSNIVPRVSVAHRIGLKGQASLAYGIFYQRPEKDFFLRNYLYDDLAYMKATHYIANYQTVSRDYTFRAEIFYKKYNDLLKTYTTTGGMIADSVANGGYGDAKGFELFWRDRKTLKNVDYWISYSYLDTKRDHLNFPHSIRPGFASTHTANLVIKKFVTKLKTQFNASYTFATGRPYYDIRPAGTNGKFQIVQEGKTIPYHSMSFSLNYLPSIGKENAKRFTVFVFSINNVLGSDQVFGYNFSYNGMRKEPIVPVARRFFFIGCFLSFGVDRTEDVINSNL